MPEEAWSEDRLRSHCFALGGQLISLGAVLCFGALLPTCCVGGMWIEKPWMTGRVSGYGDLPRFMWWAIFTGPSVVSGALILGGGILLHRQGSSLQRLQRGARLALGGGSLAVVGAALGLGCALWLGTVGALGPVRANNFLVLAVPLGGFALLSGLALGFTLGASRRLSEAIHDQESTARQRGLDDARGRDPFLREPPPPPDA